MAKTYDPQKLNVSFDGSRITGFADGSMIEVTRNEDSFTLTVGADGEAARTSSANKSGEVKITLLQSSQSNDVLSEKHRADELSKTGFGVFQAIDKSGTTVINGNDSWVKKFADVGFGKELGTREWTIVCANLDEFIGGNV